MGELTIGRTRRVHPYQWLWEPLETDPTFLVRPMFGGRAVYLDGRLMLYFTAKDEPWRGVLVCTDRVHHPQLRSEFAALAPHPILPKWLYLPECADCFEPVAERLVSLARCRDPRFGVSPRPKRRRRTVREADDPENHSHSLDHSQVRLSASKGRPTRARLKSRQGERSGQPGR